MLAKSSKGPCLIQGLFNEESWVKKCLEQVFTGAFTSFKVCLIKSCLESCTSGKSLVQVGPQLQG